MYQKKWNNLSAISKIELGKSSEVSSTAVIRWAVYSLFLKALKLFANVVFAANNIAEQLRKKNLPLKKIKSEESKE